MSAQVATVNTGRPAPPPPAQPESPSAEPVIVVAREGGRRPSTRGRAQPPAGSRNVQQLAAAGRQVDRAYQEMREVSAVLTNHLGGTASKADFVTKGEALQAKAIAFGQAVMYELRLTAEDAVNPSAAIRQRAERVAARLQRGLPGHDRMREPLAEMVRDAASLVQKEKPADRRAYIAEYQRYLAGQALPPGPRVHTDHAPQGGHEAFRARMSDYRRALQQAAPEARGHGYTYGQIVEAAKAVRTGRQGEAMTMFDMVVAGHKGEALEQEYRAVLEEHAGRVEGHAHTDEQLTAAADIVRQRYDGNEEVRQALDDLVAGHRFARAVERDYRAALAAGAPPENGHYADDRLLAAANRVKAKYRSGTAHRLVDDMVALDRVRRERDTLASGDLTLDGALRHNIESGRIDRESLALLRTLGVDLRDTAGLTPRERQLWESNPVLSGLLRHHGIRIDETDVNLPKVTVNGEVKSLTAEQLDLWRRVRDGDLSAFAGTLLGNAGQDAQVGALLRATAQLRLEHTEREVKKLIAKRVAGGPEGSPAHELLKRLKTSMDNALLPGEAQRLWERVGTPYFNRAHVERQIDRQGVTGQVAWHLPSDVDRVGRWLQDLAENAPAPVVDMALDAVKEKAGAVWFAETRFGSSAHMRAFRISFFAGLSRAVDVVDSRLGGDRAQEFAAWLTPRSPEGSDTARIIARNSFRQGSLTVPDLSHTIPRAIKIARSPRLANAVFKAMENRAGFASFRKHFEQAIKEGERTAGRAVFAEYSAGRYKAFMARGDEEARRKAVQLQFERFNHIAGTSPLDRPRAFANRTELLNWIGRVMDLMPTDVEAARAGDNSRNWYAENTREGRIVRAIAGKIRYEVGDGARVKAIPLLYVSARDGGVRYLPLFEAEGRAGTERIERRLSEANEELRLLLRLPRERRRLGYEQALRERIAGLERLRKEDKGDRVVIDASVAEALLAMAGDRPIADDDKPYMNWRYADFDDFLDHNRLDDKGRLYKWDLWAADRAGAPAAPSPFDADGGVRLAEIQASRWTKGEGFHYWADMALGVVGFAAFAAAVYGSGGLALLLAPAVVGGGAVSSGVHWYSNVKHGQSASWSNPEMRMLYIGGGLGTITATGSLGTTLVASRILNNARLARQWFGHRPPPGQPMPSWLHERLSATELDRLFTTIEGQERLGRRWLMTSAGWNVADYSVGSEVILEQAGTLSENWHAMSDEERGFSVMMLGLGFAQLSLGIGLDKYQRRIDPGARRGPEGSGPLKFAIGCPDCAPAPDSSAATSGRRFRAEGAPPAAEGLRPVENPEAFTPNPKGPPPRAPKWLNRMLMSALARGAFFPDAPRHSNDAPTYTNERYAQFYGALSPEEQARLPKPGTAVAPDQLTHVLAQLPGGLEKVVLDIHAHPNGYILRGDITLAKLEQMIRAGDGFTVETRDGLYIVTANEIHLIARRGGSMARWSLGDPDHIHATAANGREHRLAVGTAPRRETGAAARHLNIFLRNREQANTLRSAVDDGLLGAEGLAHRLRAVYGEDKAKITAYQDQSGRHWALIPQLCCGGYPHYSNLDPSRLTMRQRERLDDLAQGEWLKLYADKPELAAKIDVGITGLDFSDKARRSPVDRLRALALGYPGVAWSVGEITAHKEMVSVLLGDYAWTPASRAYQEFLKRSAESGHMVLLHNDGGTHGIDEAGRPAPAKTRYENLQEMIEAHGNPNFPWLRDVNLVIAHTFFGRFVRPSDAPVTRDVTVIKWDWENHREIGRETKRITAPEHIIRMYEIAEKVPNARFDISWNDISQAYVDNPDLRRGLIRFVLDHPDRILFGSDTVKPVNTGHYNQGLYTAMPLLAELARAEGGREALWKVLRGNYEAIRDNAQRRVAAWTRDLLVGEGRQRDIIAMDERLRAVREERARMSADARRQFNEWVDKVEQLPPLEEVDGAPGVFPALYDTLGRSDDRPWTARGPKGPGTPGGHAHAEDSPQQLLGRILTGTGLGLPPALAAALVNTPLSAETANTLAFLFRGALTAYRGAISKRLRLDWEEIFEESRVTGERLDQFVHRIVSAQADFNFSERQMARVTAATRQFWTNYQHLRDLPLQRGETREDRFRKIMAKIGEYQITVDRELGGQASSLTPLDPRRMEGFLFRSAQLATYLVNDAAFLGWLSNNGFDTSTPEATLFSTFMALFGAGNAGLTGHTLASLLAGRAGVNWDSTRPMQSTQVGSMTALTLGGAAWTSHDFVQALTALGAGQYDAAAAGMLKILLDTGFTVGIGLSTRHEANRLFGWPQSKPSAPENAAMLVGSALFLRMVVELAYGSSDASEQQRRAADWPRHRPPSEGEVHSRPPAGSPPLPEPQLHRGRYNPALERRGDVRGVTVGRSETVWGIWGIAAQERGVTFEEVLHLNRDHIRDPDRISVGDRIYLPQASAAP